MGVKWHRGKWQVDLRGTYVCVAPDEATALMLEQSGKRLLALGKPLAEVRRELRGETSAQTLDECFEEWHATLTVSKDTKYRYRLNYKRAVNGMGTRPIAAITTADVRRTIAAMSHKGYSPKTVRVSISALTAVLRYAVEAGYIAHTPPIKGLPTMERKRTPRTITREQYRAMVAAAPDHFRPLVAILPLTGLRIGEAMGLTRDEVRPDGLHVTRQVKANATKRSKTKTPGSAAVVPLLPEARQWLEAQMRDGYPSSQGLLFCNPLGKPWGRTTIRRLFVDLSEAIGSEVRPHDLRHTAGSWMLAAGVPLPDVSKFLRHKNVSTTSSTYAHEVADTPSLERFAAYLDGDTAGTR